MKIQFLTLVLIIVNLLNVRAQLTGSIIVGGDLNKFYPVSWKDGNFTLNKPSELIIGRSNIHTDELWKGSVMAVISYHVSNGGHGSEFIDVKLKSSYDLSTYKSFIGGWADATSKGQVNEIIVWLRGGTTYYYSANTEVAPQVYDGIQHSLPYVTVIGQMVFNEKSAEDNYVFANSNLFSNPLHVLSSQANYFEGNVGLGKRNPTDKLEVNGNIRAQQIKDEMENWPDFVFEEDYKLTTLKDVETFIKENKHLPGVPKAKEIEENGLSLGEMVRILMQKNEELTLHLIEKDKQIRDQQCEIKSITENLKCLNEKIK